MILTRVGNKRKMNDILYGHFPTHKVRIELFFGAGGSFFNLPIPKHIILNDFDDDVTNLYLVVINQREKLKEAIERLPISQSLLQYWRKSEEMDPVLKAVRFLLLSNFTYLGKGDTLRFQVENTKKNLLDRIDPTFEMIKGAQIMNCDFREVLSKISFHDNVTPKKDCFVYLDPVYLGTQHYYRVPKWTRDDTEDCFKIMESCGIDCALSEFDSPEILKFTKEYGMNVIYLKERCNIKNTRQEILITNYETNQLKFEL